MSKKDRNTGNAKSEDILSRKAQRELSQGDLLDDPTCIDGATPGDDDGGDGDGLDLEWILEPPTLEVVSEIVNCRKNKSWINLVVQYEKQDDPAFSYEFSIEEVDS